MVEVTRSNFTESTHLGVAVLINSSGEILREWGNSNILIYPRSALKPIQSLNLYRDGVAEALNLSDDFIALTTASHHAENIHQKMINNWLKKINLKENHLSCGPSWPWNIKDQFKAHTKYKIKRKIFHNCSGKHCGLAMPLLIFSGFVFGKYWGLLIILTSTTIGATLLYMLAGLFFRDVIEEKLAPKFSKLRIFFQKNDVAYFMFFRFIGGGGLPYAIQNVLPILFNMSVKNFIIATVLGSAPSMFVTVAIGSGIESVIDKNEKLNVFSVINSPEIYLPMVGFLIILIISFFLKKTFFKQN